MRILLVDDNSEIRSTLTTFLASAGHEVCPCADASTAWSFLEGDGPPFEVLITDVRMPAMSGMELASRVRESGQRTPIIFIAGGLEAELEDPNVTFQPYWVLHKPFMMQALLDLVEEACADSLAHSEENRALPPHDVDVPPGKNGRGPNKNGRSPNRWAVWALR